MLNPCRLLTVTVQCATDTCRARGSKAMQSYERSQAELSALIYLTLHMYAGLRGPYPHMPS